jgi:EKC/KEOPS complex subunit CGI121/TPRKB
MSFSTFKVPQFPQYTVFYSFFTNISNDSLHKAKQLMIAGDKNYDFCFLNIHNLISLKLLRYSVYRSLLNLETGAMKAKTLNAEIILNLSPVNNIVDALKRFGLDDSKSQVLVVSVVKDSDISSETFININNNLLNILNVSVEHNVELTDDYLFEHLDLSKFKKLFKLNDAVLPSEKSQLQSRLVTLALGACTIRGV